MVIARMLKARGPKGTGRISLSCAPPPITMGAPAVWVRVSTGVRAPAAAVPDTTYATTRPIPVSPPPAAGEMQAWRKLQFNQLAGEAWSDPKISFNQGMASAWLSPN